MTNPILDPDGHFPYKAEAARTALATPPDPDSNNHPETWYTSEPIIDASEVYVQAQAAYLAEPTDGTRAAMDTAAQALVAARQEHRAGRDGVGILAGHPVEVVFALRRRTGRTPEQIAEQLRMPLSEVLDILGQQNLEG